MGWTLTAYRLLRNEFFPSVAQGVISLCSLAVAIVAAFAFFFSIPEILAKIAPHQPAFLPYIWMTFIVSCIFMAATSVLMQRLLRRNQDIDELKTLRDKDIGGLNARLNRAMVIHHHTAEAVRIAAAKQKSLDFNSCLGGVLGHELPEYLKNRLGNYEIHCTVKRISGVPSHGYQLVDVFRDEGQNTKARPRDQVESAESNYIYSRFRNAGIDDAKQIYIADVNVGDIWEVLSQRAHSRGYKSVLAFPLNQPAGYANLDRTVGFLGLDSPTPHAFDGLFHFYVNADFGDSTIRPEGVYKPLEELNFLYGIADSIATILMLAHDSRPIGG